MARSDDSPATWGDIKRIYKKLDARISDAFAAINTVDEKQAGFWDEHEQKLQRLTRQLRRLQKEVDELGEPEE